MKIKLLFFSLLCAFSLSAQTPPPAPDTVPKPKEEVPVIKKLTLDPAIPIIVPTARGITTTIQFPAPIRGIDGVGLAATSDEEDALFNASHSPGSRTLSVTPLKGDSHTNVNVTCNDEVYVLVLLVNADTALFKLSLVHPPAPLAPPADPLNEHPEERGKLNISPAQMLGLIDKAKAYPLLRKEDPLNVADLQLSDGPFNPSTTKSYIVQPVRVFRKGEWDALVFHATVKNTTDKEIYLDPESYRVAVGSQSFGSVFTEAEHTIEPGQIQHVWFVVQGDGNQGTNNLAPQNDWLVTFQELLEPPLLPSLLPPLEDQQGYASSNDKNPVPGMLLPPPGFKTRSIPPAPTPSLVPLPESK